MASDKPTSQSSAATTRPGNVLLCLAFISISLVGLWCMRIEPALSGYPVGYEETVATGVFPSGVPLKTRYTGLDVIDCPLRFIVPAFMAGAAGWDIAATLHNVHFLVSFTTVLAIWNVEASRERSKGKLYSYTSLFAILYQTVGAVAAVPLWYLAHLVSSRKTPTHLLSGRQLYLPTARGLLPSTLIGYLLPTIAMFIPWANPEVTPIAIAFWQFSPLLASFLLAFFSLAPAQEDDLLRPPTANDIDPLLPPSQQKQQQRFPRPPPPGPKADLPDLKFLYRFLLITSGTVHGLVIFFCLRSTPTRHPGATLSRVFLPTLGYASRLDDMTAGLHWIFQCDWLGVAAASLLWCWVAVWDVLRVLLVDEKTGRVQVTGMQLAGIGLGLVGCAVVTGPAAVMALVWSWREERLVMIEEGVRGTVVRPRKERKGAKAE